MNKPVFWIYGNQRQCRASWDQIVSQVEKKTGSPPNVETMFCGFNPVDAPPTQRWATTNNVIETLRERDMFDSRSRIIKIIGLPEEYTALTNWLHLVKGDNILVFWGPFGCIKPGSKRWITAKTTKLYKTIKAEGKVIEHPLEVKFDSEAIDWIKAIAVEYKKTITSEAARRMVRLQGKNLDTLDNSIQKLAAYQTSKEITLADVEKCCFSDYSDNEIWGFLDHLDMQESEPAINFLQNFYAEDSGSVGESFYGRVNRFFGALLQHYQFLLMLKDACGRSLNVGVAQRALSTFKKINPTKIKELREGKITLDELECRFTSWYVERSISSGPVQKAFARRKGEIYSIVSDLYNCMYWSRRYSSDASMIRLCLDCFVLLACGKLTLSQAAQIRGHKRKIGII